MSGSFSEICCGLFCTLPVLPCVVISEAAYCVDAQGPCIRFSRSVIKPCGFADDPRIQAPMVANQPQRATVVLYTQLSQSAERDSVKVQPRIG